MTKKNRKKSKGEGKGEATDKPAKGTAKDAGAGAENVEPAVVGEYKGHPVITLPDGSQRGFTFGLRKANLMLKYLNEIVDFVEAGNEAGGE